MIFIQCYFSFLLKTEAPTEAPTQAPTQAPTEAPTEAPITKPPGTAYSDIDTKIGNFCCDLIVFLQSCYTKRGVSASDHVTINFMRL